MSAELGAGIENFESASGFSLDLVDEVQHFVLRLGDGVAVQLLRELSTRALCGEAFVPYKLFDASYDLDILVRIYAVIRSISLWIQLLVSALPLSQNVVWNARHFAGIGDAVELVRLSRHYMPPRCLLQLAALLYVFATAILRLVAENSKSKTAIGVGY